MTAKGTRTDALLHADNLAAIEAIRCRSEKRMSCGKAAAASRTRVTGDGRICLDLQSSYGGIEVLDGT